MAITIRRRPGGLFVRLTHADAQAYLAGLANATAPEARKSPVDAQKPAPNRPNPKKRPDAAARPPGAFVAQSRNTP